MAGLLTEVWTTEVMEDLIVDTDFLSGMEDMSQYVEYNTINLAIAGVEPECFVNNTTYPIPFHQRTDVPVALPLDTYDTENTLVRNIEAMEVSYDKRASVLAGHKRSIQRKLRAKACYAVGPSTNSADMPIIFASGTADANGLAKITYADILALSVAFDDAEIPAEDRHIILTATHRSQLRAEDKTRFNEVMKDKEIEGFKIHTTAKKYLPRYHKTTGAKYAFGAASDANESYASIAWQKNYVGYALGTAEQFAREKDPEQRGDIMGFQARALTSRKRNKGCAAIVSKAV